MGLWHGTQRGRLRGNVIHRWDICYRWDVAEIEARGFAHSRDVAVEEVIQNRLQVTQVCHHLSYVEAAALTSILVTYEPRAGLEKLSEECLEHLGDPALLCKTMGEGGGPPEIGGADQNPADALVWGLDPMAAHASAAAAAPG